MFEETIKKGIGVGYSNYPSDAFLNEHWVCTHDASCQIFLDPLFWQSLSKLCSGETSNLTSVGFASMTDAIKEL
jgi:hypothetical protein